MPPVQGPLIKTDLTPGRKPVRGSRDSPMLLPPADPPEGHVTFARHSS